MKNSEKLTNIIESILFVSGTQVAISDIAEKLELSEKQISEAIKALKEKYSGDSGIQLLQFNKKLQFSSNPAYADDVSAVLNPIKEKELSKSMLEVAAIIAYKQPVTRIDLEEIRGNSEYAVQKLLELGVIEPVGRKDAVGRPVMFGTTDKFLKRFQISSLDELPDYDELINRIQLIHGPAETESYLYKKDVYTEETAETAAAADENAQVEVETAAISEDVAAKNVENNAVKPPKNQDKSEDFDLPDFAEEEVPDFLQGEQLDKI